MDQAEGLFSFFRLVFGTDTEGFVCTWILDQDTKAHEERYWSWPNQIQELIQYCQAQGQVVNVYFCPQLLRTKKRNKDNILSCPNIWADLDECTPDKLILEPSAVVESSPGRYQAYWRLNAPVAPEVGEAYSMRVAYYHEKHGADRSGWDLSQLLRVPGTTNFKYHDRPPVTTVETRFQGVDLSEFEVYPEVERSKNLLIPFPTQLPDKSADDICDDYRQRLDNRVFGLRSITPGDGKWSERLWKLMMYLFEAGMDREEVFIVAENAACNKYERDGKPRQNLWRDVCRAFVQHQQNSNVVGNTSQQDLISDSELEGLKGTKTFIEDYIEWASGLGDAATQYHQAGAFTILSAVLSGNVRIPTSYGTVLPNLWFMILADTTLTRKSTAMDIATDLLFEVNEDYLLATDGSVEGLMTGLSTRPGEASLFVRDEFSGLLSAISKKDYMAGMGETLTKLYDGKPMKRVLRKEVISISKPVLLILAGGIKAKVQSILSFEDVSSGFIPRFLFITAESQVSKVRPLGPPTARDMGIRDQILDKIREIREHYGQTVMVQSRVEGVKVAAPAQFDVSLTKDAWGRYGKLEHALLYDGVNSSRQDLMTPTYARLAVSALKAAALIAASEQRGEKVVVEEHHVVHACKFVQGWRDYANDVINGIGRTAAEAELGKILEAIMRNPGITRSRLMQNYHLSAMQANGIFSTLEQRGNITATRQGAGFSYWPVTV